MTNERIGKILVVDDEQVFIGYIKSFFSIRGYNVLTATSGEEALGIIHSDTPDLVVADIRMPGMNGLELTKAIRADYPNLPVVLVTAANISEEECISAGANAFFQKPVSSRKLSDKIKELLAMAPTIAQEKGERGRIMIADDERGVAEEYAKTFQEEGFEIAVALNGEEAIALHSKFKPHFVLLDLKMPKVHGQDVLVAIENSDVPPLNVFICTGLFGETPDVLKELGYPIFHKPPELDRLRKMIDEDVKKYKLFLDQNNQKPIRWFEEFQKSGG